MTTLKKIGSFAMAATFLATFIAIILAAVVGVMAIAGSEILTIMLATK